MNFTDSYFIKINGDFMDTNKNNQNLDITSIEGKNSESCFKADIKPSFKYRAKQQLKKLLQPGCLSEKDKGKYIYYQSLSMPIKKNYIFYEAFAGLGILDNPRALFKYMLSQPNFKHYTHVWSIDNLELAKDNIDEFAQLDNVIIVKRESDQYYEHLATCQYLISNSTFGYYFEKRPEQIYINTWHGVPTKYMGYEHTVERVENGRGPAKNFLVADYVISANRFMTNIMYKRSYKTDGLFDGNLLELGYPRSDSIINPDVNYVNQKLNSLGIETDKKIILYAPTWKGNLYNQLEYNVDEFKDTLQRMSQNIDTNEYRIYLRVHYFLYKILAKDPELEKILIPFTIDTNELLSIVDILISDYSSIFFDFLPTGRPMLFYVPDLDQYQSGRGLYIPVEKLPGLVTSDVNLVANALGHICYDESEYINYYADLHGEMCEWCCYNDDGLSCQRIVDTIFRNKEINTVDNSFDIIYGFHNSKKKMLICVNTRYGDDDFYASLKEKLSQIDYTKTDVTLLVTSFKNDNLKNYFNELPEPIRIFVWYALPFATPNNSEFYQHEVQRIFGNLHFDHIIVEGPTTNYWANLLNVLASR